MEILIYAWEMKWKTTNAFELMVSDRRSEGEDVKKREQKKTKYNDLRCEQTVIPFNK